jgi:hypothetical protein
MADSLIDTNAGEVADWVDDQAQYFGTEVEKMLDRTTERTYDKAREEVPVDTGALMESLTKNLRSHKVYSELDYAPHVGLGTIYMDRQPYLWKPGEKIFEEEIERMESIDLG